MIYQHHIIGLNKATEITKEISSDFLMRNSLKFKGKLKVLANHLVTIML